MPDLGLVDQTLLQKACEQLGWHYQVRGQTLRITQAGAHGSLHGEAALTVTNNRVVWNSYYLKDGAQRLNALRETYSVIFNEMRVAYALEAVLTEFRKRGFSKIADLHFEPNEQVRHRFYFKGKSRLKQEDEPIAKIRIEILADGSLRTDSNYIPEDIHRLADEAMDAIAQCMGTTRKVDPKEIPAKYRGKAFCKPKTSQNLKNQQQ